MKRAALIVSMAFVSLTMSRVSAQAEGPTLRQGTRVLLTLPLGFLKEDTHFSGWNASMKTTSLDALIEAAAPGTVSVQGDSEWKLSGFPSLLEMEVKNIRYEGGKHRTRVDVKTPLKSEVRLFFAGQQGDAPGLFAAVTIDPSEKESYLKATYAALAKHFLASGPLASLSEEKQTTLVQYAHITAHGARIGTTNYKDKLYLVVSLPAMDTVFNDLRMNRAQRVARVLNDSLLVAMKAFASVVADVESVHGLKLELAIPHRPFTQATGTELDSIEIYAPSAEIKRFAEADITSQELIDKSVVIVNSNRTEVRLSES
jgi:hypothetical protein